MYFRELKQHLSLVGLNIHSYSNSFLVLQLCCKMFYLKFQYAAYLCYRKIMAEKLNIQNVVEMFFCKTEVLPNIFQNNNKQTI